MLMSSLHHISFGLALALAPPSIARIALSPHPPHAQEVEAATAQAAEELQRYTEHIPGTQVRFEMLPIPGGSFLMGSPDTEAGREASEGPRHEVQISPFWIEVHEVTWEEYQLFMLKLDLQPKEGVEPGAALEDPLADAVSRPTPPYLPMDFGMGTKGKPAICMTQFAAKQYTKWLSLKTGRFYRLPTEAEWEYACRAGTSTAYSFGDSDDELDEYAWYFDNADDQYQGIMLKKPNPWGLYDMHGNVAEWVLDAFDAQAYAGRKGAACGDPIVWPEQLYPRTVRGGSWDDDPELLRSAARRRSNKGWKVQDPQLPKSIWYHTDASFVGFRVVRPLKAPPLAERAQYWEADLDSIRKIQDKQRRGER